MRFSEMLRDRSRPLALAVAALAIGASASLVVPIGQGIEPAGAAPLNTYTVTSTADDGSPGTLRWAMTEANNSPGEDAVQITVNGTLRLSSPLPDTTGSVTIEGPGASRFIIDGAGHRLFRLSTNQGSTTFVNLADLTLTGAPAIQGGVLLKRHGNAALDGVVVTGNSGSTASPLIHNLEGGILTISDSTFTGNTGVVVHSDHGNTPTTTGPETGYSNRTYISDSTFSGNGGVPGECVIRTERFLRLVDSSITDNDGRALCLRGLNGSAVQRTTITGNGSDGINMHSWGSTTHFQNAIRIDDVTVYDNGGAGLTAGFYGSGVPRPADELLISNSVVFGNLAGDVTGAIYSSDPTNLVDDIIGIPRPPGTATGTGHDRSVALSWPAPTFDSGSPVTSYTATASPGGATCSSATTSCVVPGLVNGTSYTFEVVATNARGDSWASAASAPVVPDPAVPVPTTAPPTTAPVATVPATTAPATTAAPSSSTPLAPPPARILTALPLGLDVPAEVRPGQTVTLTGSGFAPGERVQVILMPEPVVLAEVLADGTGTAVASVTIPLAVAAGEHHLYMFGTTSRTGIGGPTNVVLGAATPSSADARPGSLAFTGTGAAQLLALGVMLGLLGLSLRFGGAARRANR